MKRNGPEMENRKKRERERQRMEEGEWQNVRPGCKEQKLRAQYHKGAERNKKQSSGILNDWS